MIRASFEIVFPLLIIVGLLFYLGQRRIKQIKENHEPLEAYFTGGPLNGVTKKLKTYTPKYTYDYRKFLGAQDHGTFKSYNEENWVAVYNHDGNGTYAYQGSVDKDGKMVQDKADV